MDPLRHVGEFQGIALRSAPVVGTEKRRDGVQHESLFFESESQLVTSLLALL